MTKNDVQRLQRGFRFISFGLFTYYILMLFTGGLPAIGVLLLLIGVMTLPEQVKEKSGILLATLVLLFYYLAQLTIEPTGVIVGEFTLMQLALTPLLQCFFFVALFNILQNLCVISVHQETHRRKRNQCFILFAAIVIVMPFLQNMESNVAIITYLELEIAWLVLIIKILFHMRKMKKITIIYNKKNALNVKNP